MIGLDVWMRENALTYVWIGSYAVALLILAIEIVLVIHKRRVTLRQIRLLRDAGEESRDEGIT